tara:strand:- start:592 stop:846 length:255 start_codon:yes stop_codon:yes gene_type:complete
MQTYEVAGTYGSNNTPCTVFVYELSGTYWHACEGSVNVNATFDHRILEVGVDVEGTDDVDVFTADNPVTCTGDLKEQVEDYLNG